MVDFDEAVHLFNRLFKGEMSENEAKALLISLYTKGESAVDIAAATTVMREHSIKLDIDDELREKLIDVVGTGGDKSGSFNISSTVALLLASSGSYVAKHGNRAITSKSGSADMLEALGINLNLTPQKQAKMLEEVGFTFLFAQNHHPAMKYIMPIRKSIEHRTIFNILGPLTNPAGAQKYMLGVFSKDFLERIVNALKMVGATSAVAVSSKDGMDEVSISDVTYAVKMSGDEAQEFIIDPQEYGFKLSPQEAIKGGDAKANAKITKDILQGKKKGAKRDIVLLNAAVAFVADKKAGDIQEGIERAKEAIDSKRAKEHLEKIIEVSQKL